MFRGEDDHFQESSCLTEERGGKKADDHNSQHVMSS